MLLRNFSSYVLVVGLFFAVPVSSITVDEIKSQVITAFHAVLGEECVSAFSEDFASHAFLSGFVVGVFKGSLWNADSRICQANHSAEDVELQPLSKHADGLEFSEGRVSDILIIRGYIEARYILRIRCEDTERNIKAENFWSTDVDRCFLHGYQGGVFEGECYERVDDEDVYVDVRWRAYENGKRYSDAFNKSASLSESASVEAHTLVACEVKPGAPGDNFVCQEPKRKPLSFYVPPHSRR